MKFLLTFTLVACLLPLQSKAQKIEASHEGIFSLSNKLYGVEDSPGIGTKEFNKRLNDKISVISEWPQLLGYFILQSDKSGHMVRFRYLEKEVVVIHIMFDREGLVVLKTIFRRSPGFKTIRVVESSIYSLKGIYVPSEDIVPIDDSSYWRKRIE